MHEVGIEVLALGALKLTGFLKELMQQRNINFQSLHTVRTIKEVHILVLETFFFHWIDFIPVNVLYSILEGNLSFQPFLDVPRFTESP